METLPQPTPSEGSLELVPQNIIRVETALSRFPIHRLGTRSNVKINIREKGQHGEVNVKWAVKHQPGPLAYKIDTLIVNRRIEEASRPVPKVIKLGSLRKLCRELGISEGKGTQNVRDAIYQNAEAFITAKTSYKTKDGVERTIEAGFSRYSVIFTGESLPDGTRANAVYIVLNDIFMQVLNGAMTRPLDYDYLRGLPPGPQRFYEILSYQVFAALKNNRPKAKLTYSQYCTYAPQTRYFDYERVKKQMFKVHLEHRKSGYIKSVEFEATTDGEGKADWFIYYVPGPRARAEFRAFTKRGGPLLLEVEQPLNFEEVSELGELERELVERGVTESTAVELVSSYPESQVRTQIEHFDFLTETSPETVKNPGAWLPDAIRKRYGLPKGFTSKAEREAATRLKEERAEQEVEQRRRDAHEKRAKAQREIREAETRKTVVSFWEGLTEEERQALTEEALEHARPEDRKKYLEEQFTLPSIREFFFKGTIRDPHIRKKLGLPLEEEG